MCPKIIIFLLSVWTGPIHNGYLSIQCLELSKNNKITLLQRWTVGIKEHFYYITGRRPTEPENIAVGSSLLFIYFSKFVLCVCIHSSVRGGSVIKKPTTKSIYKKNISLNCLWKFLGTQFTNLPLSFYSF